MSQAPDNVYPGSDEYAASAQTPYGYDGAGDTSVGEPVIPPPAADEPRGLWGFWLRLTGPRVTQQLDAAGRDRIRRSRLISVMLLVTLVVMLAILPKGFIPVLDFGTFGGVAIAFLTLIICIPLNRAGLVDGAGVAYCIGVSLALAWSLLDTPNGLGMQDLPTYDLFSLPIVIAGILLPRRAPFFFWIGCSFFIIGDVTYEAHQANLYAYILQVGLYATVIIPLMLTFVIAVVSWLGAGSVERAILEADRGADLERAYRLIAEQKRRLEAAITMIQNVHARVASGDFTARASGGGELFGVGASLNLMLDRLARLRGNESALGVIEQGGRRLAQYAWELGAGHLQSAPPQTGSPLLDTIGVALDQMRRSVYVQVTSLALAVQAISKTGDELVAATRALGWRHQESARRSGALSDTLQAMRDSAERAESALIAPADWLEQATAQGWADGAALAQTVAEGLAGVRQTLALADQSPSGVASEEAGLSSDRDVFERAGAAEREFTEAITQARGLLSRLANQSSNLGPPGSAQ